MGSKLPLFPEQASSFAPDVDQLYAFLIAVTIFFSTLIFLAIFYFALKYRRRSEHELPRPVHGGVTLEIVWSVIPFGLTMVMFAWGTSVFFKQSRPPDNAIQIYVVAKQWMWKLQHPEGQREINELHVPVGRPVRLVMTSEDVIHSFFVPAFRTKQDVVPGRYSTLWFEATKTGKYHLFCTEYCGTNHSGMIGWVYAMEPQDYQAWLTGGGFGSLADRGRRLFEDFGCQNCHKPDSTGRGPVLAGLFGKTVAFNGGGSARVDEAYVRQSILDPAARVAAGFQPIMPTYQGQVTEEGILQLIEYIKSLGERPGAGSAQGSGTTPALDIPAPANATTRPSIGTSVPKNR